MSINKVIISGNLTRDPELRQTAAGMPVLGFGVAVNDRRRNAQTGEWEDYPNFVDCTMFGSRAEAIERYLAKGQKVAVEGKLRWSKWERDGQTRSKLEVVVDEIEFMSQRQSDSGGSYVRDTADYAPSNNNARQVAPQPQQQRNRQYDTVKYDEQQYMAPYGYGQQTFDASSSVYDEDIPF